jgi:F-type H+-transporting ATPase subunit delta
LPSQTKESGGLSERYASALFELADEARTLDQTDADLRNLARMVEESADLKRLIRSPVLSRDEQGKAMSAILQAAEMGDLTRRFIGLLVRNRRLFALAAIIKAFRDLLAGRRGEVAAEVTSAKALTDAQVAAIAAALKKVTGSDVSIAQTVDPELLGGLVVRMGSRMIDSSLRTKLQRMRLARKGVG